MTNTQQPATGTTVPCATCQKPLRKDGGLFDRASGAQWHESCPDPDCVK
jgi:hypothetical protein